VEFAPENHDQKHKYKSAVLAIASNSSFVFALISNVNGPANIRTDPDSRSCSLHVSRWKLACPDSRCRSLLERRIGVATQGLPTCSRTALTVDERSRESMPRSLKERCNSQAQTFDQTESQPAICPIASYECPTSGQRPM